MPTKNPSPDQLRKWRRTYYLKNQERFKRRSCAWRKANPEQVKAYNKSWYQKNRAKHQASCSKYNLRIRYGLTPDTYQQMKRAQGGVCALCKKKRHLFVDHCHRSKKVRGLLCNKCNLGLGHFEDSVAVLNTAIAYLT